MPEPADQPPSDSECPPHLWSLTSRVNDLAHFRCLKCNATEVRPASDIEPPFFSEDLVAAMTDMGRALTALRVEVPASVADDIWRRWSALLDAIGDTDVR